MTLAIVKTVKSFEKTPILVFLFKFFPKMRPNLDN